MKFRSFFAAVVLSLFAFSSANPAPRSATIRLDAQLWTRPLGKESKLKFWKLGEGKAISATLEPTDRLSTYSTRVEAKEIVATATFLLIPPTAKARSYVITQVRVYDAATRGLIAECANYNSIEGERVFGVGVCSGAIGGHQFGLTLSRSSR